MTNPYVGPRPFNDSPAHQARFFGRDNEADAFCRQLASDRILVLHSPSGAGKTSLIQAGLIPRLKAEMQRRERGIQILDPLRVGLPLPQGREGNRPVFSILRSIESSVLRAQGKTLSEESAAQLVGMELDQYCLHRSGVRLPDLPTLLIFDQFEEVFTRDRGGHRQRVELFTQLARVLCDPGFWAVIALREEHVAALDAYKRLLPTQLASRFHLDFLSAERARECIRGPAQRVAQVAYEDAAVGALARDLTRDPAHPAEDALADDELALVDPLHLQLVCWDLWERLAPAPGSQISGRAVTKAFAVRRLGYEWGEGLSPVDQALFAYYQEEVAKAANPPPEGSGDGALAQAAAQVGPGEAQSRERRLRDWIERHLIEQDRYRRQAQLPEGRSELGEGVARLVDAHLLRPAVRPGQTPWYEISHDRLVLPIRSANQAWFDRALSELEKQARRWCHAQRPADFAPAPKRLLDDYERTRAAAPPHQPDAEERCEEEFVRFCRERLGSAARARQLRLLRSGALALLGVLLVGVPLGWLAYDQTRLGRELALSRERIGRLVRHSSVQHWREGNQGTALLLALRAQQLIDDQATARRLRRAWDPKPMPQDTVSASLWTALQADPFAQTLPDELLGGDPVRIEGDGARALVWVRGQGEGASRVLEVEIPDPKGPAPTRFGLRWLPSCGPGVLLTRRGSVALNWTQGEIALVDTAQCDRPPRPLALPLGPPETIVSAWSPDGRTVALATPRAADGGARVALIDTSGGRPPCRIPAALPPLGELPENLGRSELPDRQPRPTALAFFGSAARPALAVGFDTGQVLVAGLDGEVMKVRDLTAPPLWPDAYENDSKPRHWALNGEIVRLAAVSLPGRLDTELRRLALGFPQADWELVGERAGESQWLMAVFRGGRTSRGGKVFLYPAEALRGPGAGDSELAVELIPNNRGQAGRELDVAAGRTSVHATGDTYLAAAYSAPGRILLVGTDEGTLSLYDLNDLTPARYRIDERVQSDGDYYDLRLGLGVERGARIGLAAGYRSVAYLKGSAQALFADPTGKQLVAAVGGRGLRLWTRDRPRTAQSLPLLPHPGDCPPPQPAPRPAGSPAEAAVPGETPCRPLPFIYDLVSAGGTFVASSNDGLVAAFEPTDRQGGGRGLREVWKTHRLPTPVQRGRKPRPPSVRSADWQDGLLAAGAAAGKVWVHRIPPAEPADWIALDPLARLHRDGLWAVRFRPRHPGLKPGTWELASAEYHMDLGPARVLLRRLSLPEGGTPQEEVLGCGQFPPESVGETRIAFSRSGCRVALSAGQQLRVFDLAGPQCPPPRGGPPAPCTDRLQGLPPLPGRERAFATLPHSVFGLALSPDGRYVAAGSTNGEIFWADLGPDPGTDSGAGPAQPAGRAAPLRLSPLEGSRGTVLDLAFLPAAPGAGAGGTGIPRLASVGKDGLLRIWSPGRDAADPTEIRGAGTELYALALGEDGLVAAGASNGTVQVWDLGAHKRACRMLVRDLLPTEWQGLVDPTGDGGAPPVVCPGTPAAALADQPSPPQPP